MAVGFPHHECCPPDFKQDGIDEQSSLIVQQMAWNSVAAPRGLPLVSTKQVGMEKQRQSMDKHMVTWFVFFLNPNLWLWTISNHARKQNRWIRTWTGTPLIRVLLEVISLQIPCLKKPGTMHGPSSLRIFSKDMSRQREDGDGPKTGPK